MTTQNPTSAAAPAPPAGGSAAGVRLPAELVAGAARALSRAGRWAQAEELLAAAVPGQARDQVIVALAAAAVAVEQDWSTSTRQAPGRLQRAEQALAALPPSAEPDPAVVGWAWDVAYLRVRDAYTQQLRAADGSLQLGPRGRDADQMTDLVARAEALHGRAPDPGRRGWASMYLGLIRDNVLGERDVTPAHYRAALQDAEVCGDDHLRFEALRHLGDHDHDDGDHAAALDRWQQSTSAAARAGTVTGTLAQQLLLAVLAREAGDEAGARALATEVARWAEAIGALGLAGRARGLLAGVDFTAPPPAS